jgi:hypothetical protein
MPLCFYQQRREQMTKREFQEKAKAAFLKANPTATIGWVKSPKFVTYPTGVQGWRWEFYATAEGYRSREITAEGDETYVMVR